MYCFVFENRHNHLTQSSNGQAQATDFIYCLMFNVLYL